MYNTQHGILDPLTGNVYTCDFLTPTTHCNSSVESTAATMFLACLTSVYMILRNVFIPYKGVVVGRAMECFELHQPVLCVSYQLPLYTLNLYCTLSLASLPITCSVVTYLCSYTQLA